MQYYTYAYLREDGTPYYIGKGSGSRLYDNHHRERRNCVSIPKDRKKIIYLKQNLTEKEAFNHEIYMIAVLGRKDKGTGILRNLTNGGDGSSGAVRSEEFKRNLSLLNTGKKFSEEHKKKISTTRKKIGYMKEHFRISFYDGKQIEIFGLKPWIKENGYDYTCISRLRSGKYKKHKDIVSVEKLDPIP
jgi:hypothetical protein